jgi:hypothetical protein
MNTVNQNLENEETPNVLFHLQKADVNNYVKADVNSLFDSLAKAKHK